MDNLKDSLLFVECVKWTSAIELTAEIIDLTPHAEKFLSNGCCGNFFRTLSEKNWRATQELFGSVFNSPFQISLQEKNTYKKKFLTRR